MYGRVDYQLRDGDEALPPYADVVRERDDLRLQVVSMRASVVQASAILDAIDV